MIDADAPYKSLSECRSSPEYADTLEEVECRIKDLCRGLAEVKQHENEPIVQFIHQSVKDFLLQDGLRILDSSFESIDEAVGHAHLRLSGSCIKYVSLDEVLKFAFQIDQNASKPMEVPPELSFWIIALDRGYRVLSKQSQKEYIKLKS